MAYIKHVWTTNELITADKLNHAESGIQSNTDALTSLQSTVDSISTQLGFVTPEMFGAKGDGVTDDRLAIIEAIKSGYPVVFNAASTYGITAAIYPREGNNDIENVELYGNGCTIKALASFDRMIRLTNAKIVTGFNFDLDNHNMQQVIIVTNNDIDIDISRIKAFNLRDTNSDLSSTIIYVNGCRSAWIRDVTITNCKKIGNGIVGDSNGALTGISVNNYRNVFIDNIFIRNIHNIDSQDNIVQEDCAGIYVRNSDSQYSYEYTNTVIKNIYGYNFGKRLIKTQCPNVIIDNVWAYNDATDMLAAISIQDLENGWGKYCQAIVSNSILKNRCTSSAKQSMIASSEDVLIQNCFIDGGTKNYCIENLGDMKISNCKLLNFGIWNVGRSIDIDNVYFEGAVFNKEDFADSEHPVNSSNLTNTKIFNSTLKYKHLEPIEQSAELFYRHRYGEMLVDNVTFEGRGIYIGAQCTKTTIRNSDFVHQTEGDLINVFGGTLVLNNLSIEGDSSLQSSIRAIYLQNNTVSCTADNIRSNNKINNLFVGSGNLSAKNVDMNKVYANSMTSANLYPEYYDALPTKAQVDFLCILKTDGKLYKCTSVSPVTWTAIN